MNSRCSISLHKSSELFVGGDSYSSICNGGQLVRAV